MEGPPREGVNEEEQDGGRLGQGGKERRDDGVDEDEGKGEVAGAVGVRFALSALHKSLHG